MRRARGAEMPPSFWTDPLMYQGGSDRMLGPRDDIVAASEADGIDFEAELAVNDAADWATLSEDGTLAALDVRATLKTQDGALIYVEYGGRMDMTTGLLATAPTFQTSAPDYLWLNRIQAVAAGTVDMETGTLVYRLYEARVQAS